MTEDEIRAQLDALGARRAQLKDDEESLREDTRTGLRAARGLVPMAEAARRTGLNRSTVYELYLAEGDEDVDAARDAAHGGAEAGQ